MQEFSRQGALDYTAGQLYGPHAAFALLLSRLSNLPGVDIQELLDTLQRVADHTIAIDTEEDLLGEPREHSGPFYEGVRDSIERITQDLMLCPDIDAAPVSAPRE